MKKLLICCLFGNTANSLAKKIQLLAEKKGPSSHCQRSGPGKFCQRGARFRRISRCAAYSV